jgi:hypothetical protein
MTSNKPKEKIMNTRNILTKVSLAIAIATLLATSAIWEVRRVRAAAARDPDRMQFGMVGITRGQTMRLNVVNLQPPPDNDRQYPPDPCRVLLSFRNAEGQAIRNSEGQIIRRTVELQAGESAFLDLNGDMFGGPSTNADTAPGRVQLRPFVRVLVPPSDPDKQSPSDPCRSTGEVFDNATLQTSFVVPGVEAASGPQHNETLVRDQRKRER